MVHNGSVASSICDICEIFVDSFESVYAPKSSGTPFNSDVLVLSEYSAMQLTETEVFQALVELVPQTGPGPYRIPTSSTYFDVDF